MTTFDSAQYANAVAMPRVPNDDNVDGARLRRKYAKLTGGAQTLAQNDLVNLFILPRGAAPVAVGSRYGAFGASVTLDIGWSGDEDALESALDVSAAGKTFTLADDVTPLSADTIVQAKFEGANPADDKDLEIEVWYVLD